ncbi:hypothetical protein ABZ714_30490 [Streptomyces sp. NPDC006798]|uniref:hypothetical protein n=1 Tax=Streptomyces sp. NPDC006798 TaxID=3155462 RepID=UPI0033C8CB69
MPLAGTVETATASLNGVPLTLREFSAPFPTGLIRRHAWGIWGGVTPLVPGQYVPEIKAANTDGFRGDTTYHLESTAP